MAAHEFPLTDFSRAVQPALDRLPISRTQFSTTLEPNLSLRSPRTGFSATPDLALVAMPVQKGPSQLLAIVECAFSQDHASLMQKIRHEIEGWPEIALVVLILVSEPQDYHSPKEEMMAWKFFSQHERCLSPEDFLALPASIDASDSELTDSDELELSSEQSNSAVQPDSAEQSSTHSNSDDLESLVLKPVMIAGHTWCHIGTVEYQVWIKNDGDEKINLDDNERRIGVGGLLYHSSSNSPLICAFSSTYTLGLPRRMSSWQSEAGCPL